MGNVTDLALGGRSRHHLVTGYRRSRWHLRSYSLRLHRMLSRHFMIGWDGSDSRCVMSKHYQTQPITDRSHNEVSMRSIDVSPTRLILAAVLEKFSISMSMRTFNVLRRGHVSSRWPSLLLLQVAHMPLSTDCRVKYCCTTPAIKLTWFGDDLAWMCFGKSWSHKNRACRNT